MKINEDYIFHFKKQLNKCNVWRNNKRDIIEEDLTNGGCTARHKSTGKCRQAKNFDQAIEWLEILGRIRRPHSME